MWPWRPPKNKIIYIETFAVRLPEKIKRADRGTLEFFGVQLQFCDMHCHIACVVDTCVDAEAFGYTFFGSTAILEARLLAVIRSIHHGIHRTGDTAMMSR